uniref:Uncharacterized protein n=1 Tax=Eptatretus burgeri TaxID=7764 RepID=A0A8C4N640_EPTBU
MILNKTCFNLLTGAPCVVIRLTSCFNPNKFSAVERVRREMPNWSYWTSDFWGWVAQMRELGVRQPIRDLARIFWAHFPIATSLGYDHVPFFKSLV